ncbi:glutathione S-transferase [Thalassotalea loyana]|uniref:glutathione transferase n=1 Tax=Thalassotalea loyana TaxID=280483 RepID=A0ABQ6H6H9_9GAMM|nr:glutathione S-transferase family protein [Thalassotalea loyana]GLX83756.1 glutathione S-transferase [Thalassotalea loyana]
MIKVVSFEICPFVQRVTGALAAKNIPYEIEYINLKNKPQWFLDISPNGQVPILITESGKTLFESDAIIEYIEDEYGAIEPDVSNEQRALDKAWSYLGAKHYLAQCSAMSSKDQSTFEQRTSKLMKAFAKVEAVLNQDNLFFKSNELSNVDIAWLPLLHRAAIVERYTGFDFLSGFPKVKWWQKAIMNLGIVEKTVSSDFEKRFKDFYLTNTYLADGNNVDQVDGCGTTNCCG